MAVQKSRDPVGLPASEPLALVELVSYQEGSIVSRTLAKTSGGTVTLFAFDSGQSLSEHSAPFDAIVHIVDGEAELVIGGKNVSAAAGHAILMPANVPHAVHAPKRFKMLLVMLKEVGATESS